MNAPKLQRWPTKQIPRLLRRPCISCPSPAWLASSRTAGLVRWPARGRDTRHEGCLHPSVRPAKVCPDLCPAHIQTHARARLHACTRTPASAPPLTYGEQAVVQRVVRHRGQEVGLILHWVSALQQRHAPPMLSGAQLRVVACRERQEHSGRGVRRACCACSAGWELQQVVVGSMLGCTRALLGGEGGTATPAAHLLPVHRPPGAAQRPAAPQT